MALKLHVEHPNGATAEYHKIALLTCAPCHDLTLTVQHYKDDSYRYAFALSKPWRYPFTS